MASVSFNNGYILEINNNGDLIVTQQPGGIDIEEFGNDIDGVLEVNEVFSTPYDLNSPTFVGYTEDGGIVFYFISYNNEKIYAIATNSSYKNGDIITFTAADYTIPCYLRGTSILTSRGKVPVEELRLADKVLTLSHKFRPIKWIGRRSYARPFIRKDMEDDVLPIRVRKGALGHGVPHRDLHVSPGHALYFEDTLIPAKALVNGLTVTRVGDLEQLDYFHILLDQHDVIWAEGAAAESYEIHGNLKGFSNWAEYEELCGGEPAGEPQDCFPRRSEGPVCDRLRALLLERAEAIGFSRTSDPGLTLTADGVTVEPQSVEGRVCTFRLAERPSELRLASRSSKPSWVLPPSTDARWLGVPVGRIVLKSAATTLEIAHDHPALADGFHQAERLHRWTDGDALLPPSFLACLPEGAVTVKVHLAPNMLPYYIAPVDEPPMTLPQAPDEAAAEGMGAAAEPEAAEPEPPALPAQPASAA